MEWDLEMACFATVEQVNQNLCNGRHFFFFWHIFSPPLHPPHPLHPRRPHLRPPRRRPPPHPRNRRSRLNQS